MLIPESPAGSSSLRSITNGASSKGVVPTGGQYGSVSSSSVDVTNHKPQLETDDCPTIDLLPGTCGHTFGVDYEHDRL